MKRHATAKIQNVSAGNNEAYNAMLMAANECGLTVLQATRHEFYPQGLTAVAILAESHISIHTYPEDNEIYVDVFTCGHKCPKETINKLSEKLGGEVKSLTLINREV